ncbi:Magnesium-transporting ATPase, P-type 1 [Bacillus pseudomycoides]|nr:Magnesium-transporting ATPase, P-type 1 [Bacillus pseudomycoides]
MGIATRDVQSALAFLETTPNGISEKEAERRIDTHGRNEVAHEKPPAWYLQLLLSFKNPFVFILLALGILSFLADDMKGTIVVTVSATIRFLQGFRSQQAAEKLKERVCTTATVLRTKEFKNNMDEKLDINNNQTLELPIEDLVPGDVIKLSAGDIVPANVRILSAKDLFVNQAALTGEALPVEKPENYHDSNINEKRNGAPLEMDNLCFMGTNIISGTATAVVVSTGANSYFGSLAKSVIGKRPETSFDKGVNKVSWLLIKFMLIMTPIVFFINGISKGDWKEAFSFVIAMAVGLTPEMLPMIVTANLARGAVKMSKKKVIVKQLNSIQNLGAMDVLCTDKTGTLTEDKVVLVRYLDLTGN